MPSINHSSGPSSPPPSDTPLTITTAAFQYLGIWLDTKLDFKHHVQQICNKVNAAWHSILRTLWHIPAKVVWTIIDSCIFSIFDASYLVWPCMQQQSKATWEQLYKRIMQQTFRTPRGTTLLTLYHQVYKVDLPRCLDCLCSQYLTRMLRTPRSSKLRAAFCTAWWPYIRSRISHGPNHADTIALGRVSRDNTLISRITDTLCITANSQIDDIPSDVSNAVDLTKPYKEFQCDPQPFTDELSKTRALEGHQPELYIFTDGSMRERRGGYGYNRVLSTLYNQHKPPQYNPDDPEHLTQHREENGNIPVTLQWTQCHANTIGNDVADLCAKDGANAGNRNLPITVAMPYVLRIGTNNKSTPNIAEFNHCLLACSTIPASIYSLIAASPFHAKPHSKHLSLTYIVAPIALPTVTDLTAYYLMAQ